MMPDEIVKLHNFFTDLRAERGSNYGPFSENMVATSLQLRGMWMEFQACNPGAPVPSWWTPLTQVAIKLNRTASGVYHPDHAIDGSHYWTQAILMQKEDSK